MTCLTQLRVLLWSVDYIKTPIRCMKGGHSVLWCRFRLQLAKTEWLRLVMV